MYTVMDVVCSTHSGAYDTIHVEIGFYFYMLVLLTSQFDILSFDPTICLTYTVKTVEFAQRRDALLLDTRPSQSLSADDLIRQ